IAMGEVDHADDAVDHRVADSDQPIDRTQRQPVDKLLEEIFHIRSDSPGMSPWRRIPCCCSPSRSPSASDCNAKFSSCSPPSVRSATPKPCFKGIDAAEASTGFMQCLCVESSKSQLLPMKF